MNASRKMFIFSLIFFILCFIISSVNSSEDPSSQNIRNLEDETDEPKTTIDKVNCTDTICNMDHIKCDNETSHENCVCKEGYYSNFDNGLKGVKYCELEQKNQLTAFLLELFVGFGAGHFYRHHYLMASLKLVAFFIGIYLICLFPLTAKCVTDCCDSDCVVIVISIFFYLYALGLAFWYIWDLVYFGKNKYPDCSHDKGDIDLKPW